MHGAHVAGLVVAHADLMAQAVREILAVSCLLNDVAGSLVHVAEQHAGTHKGGGGLVGLTHRLVHEALLFGHIAEKERARHV